MTGDVVGQRLTDAEAVIERGLATFVEVGAALMRIRDERLYRVEYGTFEDYCRERWGFTDRRARQMMDAAEVAESLPTGTIVPATESQARELSGLDPETAAEVMEAAAESGKVTAAGIRDARAKVTGQPQPTRPADWTCHCGAAFKTAHTHCGTCGDHYPEPVHCPIHTATVDLSTGEILTRDDATRRFPVLDVPGATDDAVVDIANQVLTHPEDKQDYRAEQGAKWLAAQARKKDQPRDEPQTPAASHFHRLSEDVVLLDRHAAAMADAYQAADPFLREIWAGAVDALLDRLTSLSVQMASTPALRSVK